jgi:hypothetical protein
MTVNPNRYNIAVDAAGNSTITLVTSEHEILCIAGPGPDGTGGHPNYLRIVQALTTGQDPTPFLSVTASIAALDDDRVVVTDNQVTFKGEVIHNYLTGTILRYQREDRDTTNLIRFMERLAENPSRHSRDQLFKWTEAQNLVIDEDGYIVAYKGVNSQTQTGDDGEDLTVLVSVNAGGAIVDGVWVDGHVPNQPGSVIEMDRSQVQDDPSVACSTGLHVGSYQYARRFASVLLEVRVDPKDVVSVPNDSSGQKMRCCRYEVIGVHEEEEDTIADTFEPTSNFDSDAALSGLEDADTPQSFMQNLRARFRRS